MREVCDLEKLAHSGVAGFGLFLKVRFLLVQAGKAPGEGLSGVKGDKFVYDVFLGVED